MYKKITNCKNSLPVFRVLSLREAIHTMNLLMRQRIFKKAKKYYYKTQRNLKDGSDQIKTKYQLAAGGLGLYGNGIARSKFGDQYRVFIQSFGCGARHLPGGSHILYNHSDDQVAPYMHEKT